MSPQGQGLCHHSVSHKHTHTLGQFELDPWLRPHTTHITKNKNCRGVIVLFFFYPFFFWSCLTEGDKSAMQGHHWFTLKKIKKNK